MTTNPISDYLKTPLRSLAQAALDVRESRYQHALVVLRCKLQHQNMPLLGRTSTTLERLISAN
jgi:hypothetical protein